MSVVWYKDHTSKNWHCFPKTHPSMHYSNPRNWMKYAELAMKGTDTDVLKRRREEIARTLIWC